MLSFFVTGFKYCLASFSIIAFMPFICYIPCLRMFKYNYLSILIFRLNDDMSQTFQYFVIILVICISLRMTVSFLIRFSTKGVNFVFHFSLEITKDGVYNPCCISIKWLVIPCLKKIPMWIYCAAVYSV